VLIQTAGEVEDDNIQFILLELLDSFEALSTEKNVLAKVLKRISQNVTNHNNPHVQSLNV